jgi:glycerol-3-phosphate dehydrogenase
VTRDDIVWTYSGVRPLFDDGASQGAGSDARLRAEARGGRMARRRCSTVFRRQAHDLPAPGRIRDREDRPNAIGAKGDGLDGPIASCRAAISRSTGFDLPRSMRSASELSLSGAGARASAWLALLWHACARRAGRGAHDGRSRPHFGADLYEREVRWLMKEEWAGHAEDVLWRRTKRGLHLTSEKRLRWKTT